MPQHGRPPCLADVRFFIKVAEMEIFFFFSFLFSFFFFFFLSSFLEPDVFLFFSFFVLKVIGVLHQTPFVLGTQH